MTTCKSCDAEVVFVPSAKSGKAMILDAKPSKGVAIYDRFNEEVVAAKDLASYRDSSNLQAEVVDVFTDHHATCPDAASYR